MILYQWRGAASNFGDELNAALWPKLLPDFFDNDPSIRFLGIGSVLDSRHGSAGSKIVAGAGYGGYEPRARLDRTWIVHWVRGPRTARSLGLPESMGLGDPASLLPDAGFARAAPTGAHSGFMPHFESMARGDWARAATLAGVELIDPRGDPAEIVAAIGRCRVLLSEALHGAIAADTLRVPWVPMRPLAPTHRAKWADWGDSLGLRIDFAPLVPSSVQEAREGWRGWAPVRPDAARLLDDAAGSLAAAARRAPTLSSDAALDRARARMAHRLALLRRDPLAGVRGIAEPRGRSLGWLPNRLQPAGRFA